MAVSISYPSTDLFYVDDDFTGFQWLLLTFPVSYWVLQGFTRFCLVSIRLNGFHWVLLGFIGFYWTQLGFTGSYWVVPSFTGFYWVLLGFTGFYLI